MKINVAVKETDADIALVNNTYICKKTNIMPTRVERLKKRSTKVADKAVKKMKKIGGYPTNSNRSGKVLNKALKKGAKIDKKIVKTKSRVAKRAVKKDARAVNKAARVAKRAVKKDARALNRRIKKATPSAAARAAYQAKKAAKMKKDKKTL